MPWLWYAVGHAGIPWDTQGPVPVWDAACGLGGKLAVTDATGSQTKRNQLARLLVGLCLLLLFLLLLDLRLRPAFARRLHSLSTLSVVSTQSTQTSLST
jgi:hypothetical protein